jgi:deoxyribodipyrimidine photo-lyase
LTKKQDSDAIYGIHWFRRDLRVTGNSALAECYRRTNGRTLGVFSFDQKFLSRADFSNNRFQFFIETLKVLKQNLTKQGIDLLVLDCGPDECFARIRQYLENKRLPQPSVVSWNRDYEPFARERDQRIESLIQKWDIEIVTSRDHLLFEPWEIESTSGLPLKVYSAFAKRWMDKLHGPIGQERVELYRASLKKRSLTGASSNRTPLINWKSVLLCKDSLPEGLQDCLKTFDESNKKLVNIPIPKAGEDQAFARLTEWQIDIKDYGVSRDFPAMDRTSRLSPFFKNGSMIGGLVVAHYELTKEKFKGESGPAKFLSEIIWREFYYYLLWHFPRIENEAFQQKYLDLKWENRDDYFKAWCDGQTGFPIIDAAMRQLNQTGWMHNRLRMIVASFLTKDLLVDWKWGERYFMKQLLDGDLAPNNGGWQWSASTGCDAQPYFRIFNPFSQSERFDKEGVFIKSFVPEIGHYNAKKIHRPINEDRERIGYPMEIVEHSIQRDKALKLFASAK